MRKFSKKENFKKLYNSPCWDGLGDHPVINKQIKVMMVTAQETYFLVKYVLCGCGLSLTAGTVKMRKGAYTSSRIYGIKLWLSRSHLTSLGKGSYNLHDQIIFLIKAPPAFLSTSPVLLMSLVTVLLLAPHVV